MTLDDIRGRTTITVKEAGEVIGIGRDAAYAAVHRGEIPGLRLGRRLVVPVPKLLQLLGALPEDSDAGPSQEPASANDSSLTKEPRRVDGLAPVPTQSSNARNVHSIRS